MTERMAATPRRPRGSPISIAVKPMQRPIERPRTAVVKEAKTRVRGRALLIVCGGQEATWVLQINWSRSV